MNGFFFWKFAGNDFRHLQNHLPTKSEEGYGLEP
jgi:hypothetical protein